MESELSSLIANFSGRPRKAMLNGREYLVCNVTMIVPGVLAGSKGPLLYPPDEVSRNVDSWNGMPLTWRHPVINGQPVSARSPEVMDKFTLGYVYAANYGENLKAEAWFDVESTRRIDNRILQYLESGKQIEISTGLFTRNEMAPPGAVFNGTPYSHIARDYKPDHLAVLMDEVGACSIKDGCGLNVNQTTHSHPQGDFSVNKDQLITWLTTNCSCWKGSSATSALNTMTEPELNQLKVTAEQNIANNAKLTNITNALTAGFVVNGAKVTLDTTTGQFKAEQITPVTPLVDNSKPIQLTPVGQGTDVRNETFIQLLERTGTPVEKATWNTAVQMANAQKQALINRLTDGITDVVKKAEVAAVYNAMDTAQLEKIAPPVQQVNNGSPTPNYSLGAGGPLVNQNQGHSNLAVNKVDGLPVTRLTFDNPLVKKVG